MRAELTLFSLLILSQRALALEGVVVLSLSKNKKSMVLSVGASEGIEENDYGSLFFGETLVAEIQAVRTDNTSSSWIADGTEDSPNLKEGGSYRLELAQVLSHVGGGEPPTFEDNDVEEIGLMALETEEEEGAIYFDANPNGGRKTERMNRQELREYLITSGLAEEKEATNRAIHELHGHEVFLRYSSSFESDTQGKTRKIYSSFALGHEYPLGRTAKILRPFTLEIHYQKGTSPIETDNFSAEARFLSLGGGFNFYFFNKPYSIEKYMGFIGIGLERGSGQVKTTSSERSFDCDLTAFTLNAGIKYRFKGAAPQENASWSWAPTFMVSTKRTDYALGLGQTVRENYLSFGTSLYF